MDSRRSSSSSPAATVSKYVRAALAATAILAALFAAFVVIGRLICGVHWLTDIIGAVLLSAGLYMVYRSAVGYMEGNVKGR